MSASYQHQYRRGWIHETKHKQLKDHNKPVLSGWFEIKAFHGSHFRVKIKFKFYFKFFCLGSRNCIVSVLLDIYWLTIYEILSEILVHIIWIFEFLLSMSYCLTWKIKLEIKICCFLRSLNCNVPIF